jgi:hypothetical protein
MKALLFESFKRMIERIPPKAVFKAIELEHEMLEDDLLYKRVAETRDIVSILIFCKFINAAAQKDNIIPVTLPTKEVVFYRAVVKRLIRIGKLPAAAREQFDITFTPDFQKTLAP